MNIYVLPATYFMPILNVYHDPTPNHTSRPHRLLHGLTCVHSPEVGAQAPVFEKSASDPKLQNQTKIT